VRTAQQELGNEKMGRSRAGHDDMRKTR